VTVARPKEKFEITGDRRKTAMIKPIQIMSDRHPDLYNVFTNAQERGEDISKLVRSLLLRELLPGYLVASGADPVKVVGAIASLRRNMAATATELDLLELWCRRELGEAVDEMLQPEREEGRTLGAIATPPEPAPKDDDGTEELDDSW
jgi:hypothetical protein